MARGNGEHSHDYTEAELAFFEDLVARYGRHVYNVAYRLSGNEADARDLSQDAFVRVFRALRRVDPEGSIEGWLHRIVTNLYIDTVRKRPKGRVESLDAPLSTAAGGEMTRDVGDPAPGPEETVLAASMDTRVQAALLALPEDLRMVVILSDVEEYAYEEIAAMLRIPLGTVKSRLHRARRALAGRLDVLRGRGAEA